MIGKSLNEWRNLIEVWIKHIQDWTVYYRDRLQFSAIPDVPQVDISKHICTLTNNYLKIQHIYTTFFTKCIQ